MEDFEFKLLGVEGLQSAVEGEGMRWFHLQSAMQRTFGCFRDGVDDERG